MINRLMRFAKYAIDAGNEEDAEKLILRAVTIARTANDPDLPRLCVVYEELVERRLERETRAA